MRSLTLATAFLATTMAFPSSCKKSDTRTELPAPVTALPPDAPQGFGPRCVWLAFRGANPDAVAHALELRDAAPSTWAEGLKGAYAGRVFVTPQIDGWVLAASTRFPDPGDKGRKDDATPALERLSRALGEVQYFTTYDVLQLHAWARFVNGAAVRKLAFLGSDALTVWAEGEPTPEERKLGLLYTAKSLAKPPFPTEENVFAIAGVWSVDPSKLQTRNLPPSLGVMGSPP